MLAIQNIQLPYQICKKQKQYAHEHSQSFILNGDVFFLSIY